MAALISVNGMEHTVPAPHFHLTTRAASKNRARSLDDGNAETGSTDTLRKLHNPDFCLLRAEKVFFLDEEPAPVDSLPIHLSIQVFVFNLHKKRLDYVNIH